MQVTITEDVGAPEEPLVMAVRRALARALRDDSELDPAVLAMEGMSGRRYRHFVNNLVRSLDRPRYLEVGCLEGSTLCAVSNGNRVEAVGIDDWSQFGGSEERCRANVERFRGPEARLDLITSDYRRVDYGALGPFDLYLFDGPHRARDQHDGLLLALPAMARRFVLVVDDWNWRAVRMGTHLALGTLGIGVDYVAEIRTSLDDLQPLQRGAGSEWHNGYLLAVITRP